MKKIIVLLLAIMFVLSCAVVRESAAAPLLAENFDTVTPPALPGTWQNLTGTGTGTLGIWQTNAKTHMPAGINAYSASNLVFFNSNTATAGNTAALISPKFSLALLSGAKISFWMYQDSGLNTSDDRVSLYVNTTPVVPARSIPIGTISRYSAVPGWSHFVYDIPASFNTTDNYLIFNGISAKGNDIHLDDIRVGFLPGAPSSGSATRGNSAATVSFTPPVNDGGAPITGYTVTSNPPGGVDSNAGSTALTHTITGLYNGSAYTFTVTAATTIGTGPASAASNSVTPATIPDTPSNVSAIPGNGYAIVNFKASYNSSGSPISSYTVTATPGNISAVGASSPVIINGLSNGTPYTFTVKATNGVGSSPASTPSNSATPSAIPAVGTRWQSIGPSGGDISCLTIDPVNDQTVYAGTYGGLFKSTNGGAGWDDITSSITSTNIKAIAIAKNGTDTKTVYVATTGGIFKTSDAGTVWTPKNNGLTSTNIYSMAIDPNSTLTIYAGTSLGLFKTTDGGDNWNLLDTNGGTVVNVNTIAIDKSDSQIIYAGTSNGIFSSSSAGGNGSWISKNSGLASLYTYVVTIDPNNSQIIFAGTAGGVFKTSNAGAAWVASNSGLPAGYVNAIAVSPVNGQIVYNSIPQAGFFKSINGGANWSAVNSGVSNKYSLAIAISSGGQTLYSGTQGGGVLKTINAAATWTEVNKGLNAHVAMSIAVDPVNTKTIYTGTGGGGIYKTTDGGSTWNSVNNGLSEQIIFSLAIYPTNPQVLFAGTPTGVFRTDDGGGNWYPIKNGLTTLISSLALDKNSLPNSIVAYAGTLNGQVFKTSDGGGVWAKVVTPETNVRAIVIDPNNSQNVYAGAANANVHKSTNAGSTWSYSGSGMSSSSIFSLAINPANSQILYAGTSDGVNISTNGGVNWSPVNAGMTSTVINSLAVDPNNSQTIYAGTYGVVFKSVNGGANWQTMSNGFPIANVYCLAVDPKNSQNVYAGTGISLFKTVTSSIPNFTSPASTAFYIGTLGSFSVSASGWPAPTYSVSGTLPEGFTFNQQTGLLNTPVTGPTLAALGTYTLLFSANNGLSASATMAVTVSVLGATTTSVSINTPANNSQPLSSLGTISGIAGGNGLSSVSLQVTDGTYYLQENGGFAVTPVWLSATGSTSWSYTTSASWVEGIRYTVTARANSSGSPKYTTSNFSIQPSANKQPSSLNVTITPDTIRSSETIMVSGSLVKVDTSALAGKSIKIIITPPATLATPNPAAIINSYITDAGGDFSTPAQNYFTTPGIYSIQVRFEGDISYQASSQNFSLPVIAQSGYAIIVVGKTGDNSLLDLHTATATNIYTSLIAKRGFLAGDIIPVISTTNAAKLKSDISAALATIKPAYQANPAPVYLIMIDHGSSGAQGGFVMGSQTLLPSELDAMLNTFESGIDPAVLAANKRFLIMGTCYSGLFQSVSKPGGRVVISSASATEQSLAGSVSYSGNTPALSGGDYFMDTLFSFLGRGDSFKNAFNQARNAVALRDPRKVTLGLHSGEVDTMAQHPLLNDDGNATGSYRLEGSSDGIASSALYLGEGVRVPAEGNPTDITAVLPTTILGTSATSQTLWMQVNDSSRVERAWVEIRTPATTASSGGTGQVIPGGLDSMPLIYDGLKWVGDYSQFTDPGRYDVYYYARDNQTGDTSPMAHTVIYKKKPGNTAPSAFTLSTPATASQMKLPFPLAWKESNDSDGKTYSLIVATDPNFSTVVYREDDIPVGATILPESALRDPVNPGFYYCQNNNASCWWKVRAIDDFGEETWSDSRNFKVLMSNVLSVMIKAYVTSGGLPVSDASCSVSSGDSVVSLPTGLCLMTTSSLPVTASFSAAGYTAQSSVAVPDPVDNVSLLPVSLTPAVTTHTLTLAIAGSGNGLVNCSKGIESVGCNGTFSASDTISLLATNDWKTMPVSWGGSCSGSIPPSCSLLMDSDRSVIATFNPNYQARIVSPPYSSGSLQDALNNAGNGATVEAMDYDFLEPVLFDRSSFEVSIDGGRGYPGYSLPTTGYSSVQGSFRIKQGTIKVKGPIAVR